MNALSGYDKTVCNYSADLALVKARDRQTVILHWNYWNLAALIHVVVVTAT